MVNSDIFFMREAIKLAQTAAEKEEIPVGAVIIFKDQVIARAYNQVELLKDPTAHAEMIALTQATHSLGQKWLVGCAMYVTVEPCSMCAGALVLARISRLCFGAHDPKAGACGSVLNIVQHGQLNHRVDVFSGIEGELCGQLLKKFFLDQRRKGKK